MSTPYYVDERRAAAAVADARAIAETAAIRRQRFRALTDAAGLPRVRVHDLRHLAASMMIAAGVPLSIVSKTLRHSTVSITADVYSHMTADIAREAVDAMAAALDAAEAEAQAARRAAQVLAEPP